MIYQIKQDKIDRIQRVKIIGIIQNVRIHKIKIAYHEINLKTKKIQTKILLINKNLNQLMCKIYNLWNKKKRSP
jgi:hypothetical protein